MGKIAIAIAIAVLIVGVAVSPKFRAHLVGPFDPQPEIKISDIVSDPGRVAKHRADVCSWARREELRNPGWKATLARQVACGEK